MNLKHRKFIGKIWKFLYPNYSTCGRCGRTWNICESHSTPYSEHGSCFPLCQDCFNELTIDERLPYYRQLIDEWIEGGDENHNGQSWNNLWDVLEQNVRNGL